MGLLDGLLDPGFKHAASVLIHLGVDRRSLDPLISSLVASIEVVTARTEAATGSLVIEDRRGSDGRWMAADGGQIERWAPIKITADFHTHQEEVFRGYVSKITPDYPNMAGEAKLTLELQDEGSALMREHGRKVWGADAPMTDLAILQSLVAPLGLRTSSDCAQGASSRSLSQDAPAIDFIRERARASGFELIFERGEVYFGPKRLEGQAQPPILVYAGRSTNCRSISMSDDALQPDAVQLEMAPKKEGAQPVVEVLRPDETLLGSTPVSAEGASLGTASMARLGKEGDETPEEARARAQAMINEASFRVRATGELDGSLYGHVLRVGRLVSVDGAGARYGGLYYVDKVAHSFSPEGYRQSFELMRNAVGETTAPIGPLSAAESAITGLFEGMGF
jgi:hypothetical protein